MRSVVTGKFQRLPGLRLAESLRGLRQHGKITAPGGFIAVPARGKRQNQQQHGRNAFHAASLRSISAAEVRNSRSDGSSTTIIAAAAMVGV